MKTVFQLKRRQNLFLKKYLLNSDYNSNSSVTTKQLFLIFLKICLLAQVGQNEFSITFHCLLNSRTVSAEAGILGLE